MRVLKTWNNSWGTSSRIKRLQSPTLACLFGCDDGKDAQSHYAVCPILYTLQTQFDTTTPPDPLERIGLVSPSNESLLRIACTFAGYHAIKRDASITCSANNTLNIEQRFNAHVTFANAFWLEATDNGYNCRHFRPSQGFSSELAWPGSQNNRNQLPSVQDLQRTSATEVSSPGGETENTNDLAALSFVSPLVAQHNAGGQDFSVASCVPSHGLS